MPLIWRVLDRQPVGSLREYAELGGGVASRVARDAHAAELIDLLCASGLRGRGGAGFPTGTKWRTVAASRSLGEPTTVVVNAAEGEPGTFKDRALLRTNPYRVLEGAVVAAVAMETDQIRIGIKATFGREIGRVKAAIAEMRAVGWLDDFDVRLVLGPSSYLFGEETALLEVIQGRQPFPRVTPPYRRGLQEDDTRSVVGARLAMIGGSVGAPALVDNVETLANVPLIVERGAEWFREAGTERSPGSIVCTVSGATRRSGVGEVAMGSTLRDVIETIGWGPPRGREIQVVLAGTANPLIPARLLDTPLTYEAMRDAGSGLGSGGFIVFDDTTEPAAIAAGVTRFLAVESCGQCEPCKTDGLFIAEQLRSSPGDITRSSALEALRRRISTVTIGARCNLAQQQASVAASLLEHFPQSMETRSSSTHSTAPEPVMIAPIVEIVGGRALLDSRQPHKQPDWSYGSSDSGAAPAARLGNTPVHIDVPVRSREWPEWRDSLADGHPLELVDDAHAAIDDLINLAVVADERDIGRRVDDVVIAIGTHIDVTQRVLYPMVRRVDDDRGELLADAAEAHEQTLSRLIGAFDPADARASLHDIAVELHRHAHLEDEILELLRTHLDPAERESLTDGLAAARATSTVSRLRRAASRHPAPAVALAVPQQREQTERTERSLVEAPPDVEPRPAMPVTAEAASPGEPQHARNGDKPVQQAAAELTRPSGRSVDLLGGDDTTAAANTFLVGVDGSPAAAAGLEWAARLAGSIGAQILVANVFEPVQAELSPDDYDTLIGEAEHRLDVEWSAPLHDTGLPHRVLQLTGAPDRLLDATDAQHADLLVVGTRGAGRRPGLHVGSLAHHLAHHARGPLAIVPAVGAKAATDRIVVGVDGSAGSAAAVTWCATIGAAAHAEVIAVCVFEPHPRWGLRNENEKSRAIAEEAISNEWVAPLAAAGVNVRTRIVEGKHPASALAAVAEDAHAGMLVVGSNDVSDLLGRRLVRVPLQLVHLTHLPVVMVPPTSWSSHPQRERRESVHA